MTLEAGLRDPRRRGGRGRDPARHPRARAACALGALVLTPILLDRGTSGTRRVRPLRYRPAVSVVVAVIGVAIVGRRAASSSCAVRPGAPARRRRRDPVPVPIQSGGETANLLVPLYAVIAHRLAFVCPLRPYLRRARRGQVEDGTLGCSSRAARCARRAAGAAAVPSEHRPARARAPGLLEQLLAGDVVLYAMQVDLLDELHARARATSSSSTCPSHCCSSCSRGSSGRSARRAVPRRARRARPRVRGHRLLRVATRHLVLSSNALDANSYQSYFRIELAVPRPQHLRALPRRRDGARDRGGAVEPRPRAASSSPRGALLLVLLAALVLTLSQSSLGMLCWSASSCSPRCAGARCACC